MTRRPGTHGYVCECAGPCDRRLYLAAGDYLRLQRMGNVIHIECAGERKVLARFGEIVAVKATRNEPANRHKKYAHRGDASVTIESIAA